MEKRKKIPNVRVTWDDFRSCFRVHRILENGDHMWFRNLSLVCLEDVKFVEGLKQIEAIGTMVLSRQHDQKSTKRCGFKPELLNGGRADKAMLMINAGVRRHRLQRDPEVRLEGFAKGDE